MEKPIDKPVELTDKDIEQAIKKHPLLIVDCWAEWCGPCRMITPIIENLAAKHAGKIVFGKLDVDQNRETSVKYSVMSIPALLVFKEGKYIETITGYMPQSELAAKIDKANKK